MSTQDAQLFEDTFRIDTVNSEKYDRVSRLSGTSSDNTTTLLLDINRELYPITPGESVTLVLAQTLKMDGSKEEKGWREAGNEATLADMFDYVCHGKVYRFEEADNENIKVFVSFGGLLLYMQGPYKKLTPLRIDYVYMLLKK
ncbi:UDP-glucose 4-epimerase Gal10 [Patellaria atrata CBS 101060]|uniref:DNA-directed RNA polymerases I, II, and III subunit RPABC3 n=1 Tax=Patellaria atrata CBS 101060 TaxID=1346257 RepID=A0A9P4SAI3_9PEZI|nr:UDP-glucose 4-epimerase Gal10 [Patellaria atrata CBS 101060]